MKDRFLFSIDGLEVGAGLDEEFDDIKGCVFSGGVERGVFVVVGGIYLLLLGNQSSGFDELSCAEEAN